MSAELRRLADDIFSSATEPVLDAGSLGLNYDPKLWGTLTDSGLSLLTTPESSGGSGATLEDLAVVLESAGYHAAPAPLAETDLLASWLLQRCGRQVPPVPMAAAVTDASDPGELAATTFDRVPWGADAEVLVVAGPGFVAAVDADRFSAAPSTDIAGQPLATITVTGPVDAVRSEAIPAEVATEFRMRGAWARALQTTGALTRALELSIGHAQQREQFGRPIAKFQAVQALIANAANALAVAKTAAYFATNIASIHGFDSPEGRFAVAVAKIESARAATTVARNAHQVHGAIGFTLDHRLRHFTTRALAWRSEFGAPRTWQQELGELALSSATPVWDLVTRLSSTAR